MEIQSAPENLQTTELKVVARGPSPGFASGIVMATVLILGRSTNGEVRPFYAIFNSPTQQLPAVGANCTFKHQMRPVEAVGGLDRVMDLTGEVVSAFDCDLTSLAPSPPSWTPGP